MEYFRTGEVITQAWAVFKKHMLFVWMTLVILFVVQGIVSTLEKSVEEQIFLSLIASLITFAVTIVMEIGFTRVYLDLVDHDKESPYKTLFAPAQLFWQYLGATILYVIGVVVGLILLVVPGLYVLLTYQFYGYLLVDKKLGAVDALKKSAAITQGVKWQLLVFAFALIGLNIAGALVLLVGLLITIPLSALAHVIVYRKLSSRLEAQPTVVAEPMITPFSESDASAQAAVIVPSDPGSSSKGNS